MDQPLQLPPLPYQWSNWSPLSPPPLYWQMSQPTPSLPEATSYVRGWTEPEYPKWIKVHPPCPVDSVGSLPSTLGDLKQHHCNCSFSQRKAQCHLVEEQWALRGDSSPALPGGSLELAPQEEEDPGAQPKVLPLEFKEIAKSLTRGESPEMEINCPLTRASQDLLAGSAVATITSTVMCQDQNMCAISLSMVTTSIGLMDLEAPSVVVGHQGLTTEEMMEDDLVESHLK